MSNLSEPPVMKTLAQLACMHEAIWKGTYTQMPRFGGSYLSLIKENAWLKRNWTVLFSFEQREKIIAAYVAALLS